MSDQPRIYGLDLSLTGTGVATFSPEMQSWLVYTVSSKPGGLKVEQRAARLHDLAKRIVKLIASNSTVVIEAPAYSSRTGLVHERGGLYWLVTVLLAARGCRLVEVAPTARAKYITGSGRGDKKTVKRNVGLFYGEGIARNDNEADAVALCAIGWRAFRGEPLEKRAVTVSLSQAAESVRKARAAMSEIADWVKKRNR
ncbi:hypothetical protein EII30_02165 [Leucobacter sp. OH1287]|nr:hypothetical protein EII30_02165 [Leucobacter sp. OH1287]